MKLIKNIPQNVWIFKVINQLINNVNELITSNIIDNNSEYISFKRKIKLLDYLYRITYDSIDYDKARKYFAELKDNISFGGCSVVRKDNKIGRNFDYNYDETVDFITTTNNYNGRYKVIGICGTPRLTKDIVENNSWNDYYIYLPFMMRDGINEKGLYANINMLNDKTQYPISPTGNEPEQELKETINSLMLVRYVLDNFDNATEAVEYIRDYVKVIPPKISNNQYHWYIADKNKSYDLEIIGAQVHIIELGTNARPNVLTNFPLYDTSLYNGLYDIENSNIEDFGVGIERANVAIQSTNNIKTLMCDELKYTNSYQLNSQWLTEFTGIHDTTIHETDKLSSIQVNARELYLNRTRNGETWQTVHTSIYNLDDLSIDVNIQEQDKNNSITIKFV